LTGVFFVIGLLTSTQWERLVPTSPGVFVQAWNTFVLYANFHFPPEPNGFYGYNALQQLAYFATVFIMAPLSILTGMAMSPALVNHFPSYTRILRWQARSTLDPLPHPGRIHGFYRRPYNPYRADRIFSGT